MSINHKFSKSVYLARTSLGYTQEQLAEAVSVSVRWIQKIENEARMPGSVTMLRIILFLNLDIEKFREEVGIFEPISPV